MTKIKICKEPDCNNAATTEGYCRLHYLQNWSRLKKQRQKKSAERLNKYIESIVKRNPDRYVEILKKQIRTKQFEDKVPNSYRSDLDDVYKIFNDPGYEEDIENLIKDLKIEDKF